LNLKVTLKEIWMAKIGWCLWKHKQCTSLKFSKLVQFYKLESWKLETVQVSNLEQQDYCYKSIGFLDEVMFTKSAIYFQTSLCHPMPLDCVMRSEDISFLHLAHTETMIDSRPKR
jgi:hypothetical protein